LRGKQRQELLVIASWAEYLPTIIATRDNFIQTTFDFGARFPRHGERMLTLPQLVVKPLFKCRSSY
jgi:hypothetical protein